MREEKKVFSLPLRIVDLSLFYLQLNLLFSRYRSGSNHWGDREWVELVCTHRYLRTLGEWFSDPNDSEALFCLVSDSHEVKTVNTTGFPSSDLMGRPASMEVINACMTLLTLLYFYLFICWDFELRMSLRKRELSWFCPQHACRCAINGVSRTRKTSNIKTSKKSNQKLNNLCMFIGKMFDRKTEITCCSKSSCSIKMWDIFPFSLFRVHAVSFCFWVFFFLSLFPSLFASTEKRADQYETLKLSLCAWKLEICVPAEYSLHTYTLPVCCSATTYLCAQEICVILHPSLKGEKKEKEKEKRSLLFCGRSQANAACQTGITHLR